MSLAYVPGKQGNPSLARTSSIVKQFTCRGVCVCVAVGNLSVVCTNLFVAFIRSADLILIYRMLRVINVKYLTVHSHIVAGAFSVQSECFVLTACRNP